MNAELFETIEMCRYCHNSKPYAYFKPKTLKCLACDKSKRTLKNAPKKRDGRGLYTREQ